MRSINTWLLFVFLLQLATTGGEESGGQEMEEEVEEDPTRLDAPVDDDDVGERERRGLYGGSDKDGICPKQCLCLSEIQVKIALHTKVNLKPKYENLTGSLQHGQHYPVPPEATECHPGHQHHQPEYQDDP